MKFALWMALVLSITLTPAQARDSIDVKLDNANYKSLVNQFFASKRLKVNYVQEAPAEGDFVKIQMSHDFSSGASCKVNIEAKIGGGQVSHPASRSSSFVFGSDRAKFCRDFLRDSLTSATHYFL